MKVFKKFNPNENYILRMEISMIVILVAVNFAFTRISQVQNVPNTVVTYEPIDENEFIDILPPLVNRKTINTKRLGTKVVIQDLVKSLEVDKLIKEEEKGFVFNNKRPRGAFRALRSEKGDKIVYSIPDANAQFPHGNGRIPEYIKSKMEYPEEAVSVGASCIMEIELLIDKDGWVKEVRILTENEDAIYFRDGIRKVLLAMPKFDPAVVNNRYVESSFIVPIEFILD